MKKTSYLLTLLIILFLLNHPAKAQNQGGGMNHDTSHISVNEGDITWGDPPPLLPKGAKLAVLSGDPSKEGEFTVRLSMPANYKIAPHWHPTTENVTVLKGDFYLGTGDKLDENTATLLHAGGFASIPATHHHFAFTKGETVVQVHAMGPFKLTYINPADDPSKEAK